LYRIEAFTDSTGLYNPNCALETIRNLGEHVIPKFR
jgi:hypothetical protein